MKNIALAVFAALVLCACTASSSAPVTADAKLAPPPGNLAAPASAVTPEAATAAPAAASVPAPIPTAIDFDAQVLPFLTEYCLDCHDDNARTSDVRYDNKEDILKTVTPGNADDSDMFYVLSTGEMPRGDAKPSAAEIEMVRVWINQGAPISSSYPATR